jgi:hypothetical protein
MRVGGEKSSQVRSTRGIVKIEHELRKLLQRVIILTLRESHGKNESGKTCTILLVTTMPFQRGLSDQYGNHMSNTPREKFE